MSAFHSSDHFILCAFLGTHQTAIDIARDRDSLSGIDHFLSDSFRAAWLRSFRPELVPPPNPNGTSPSTRLISRHFCFHYWNEPSIREKFLDNYESQAF